MSIIQGEPEVVSLASRQRKFISLSYFRNRKNQSIDKLTQSYC